MHRSLTGAGMRILPTLDAVASALVGDSPALANTLRQGPKDVAQVHA